MMEVRFYCTETGNEPVRDWLKELDRVDRREIGNDLQTVQLGWRSGLIGEPLVKSFGAGLFEIRSTLLNGHCIARTFFCLSDQTIVLLHAFIKKTKKTQNKELELAKKRQKTLKK